MKTVLSTLVAPHQTSEFFDSFENDKPFYVHNLSEGINEITDLPMLESIESLLNNWSLPIKAHLPDVRDEASFININAQDALKVFENRMGLHFNHAEKLSPVIDQWLKQLRIDLGLSALTNSRCMLYATPAGGGTAAHFDQNINIVLQLTGEKTWWISDNEHVRNPMTRHTIGLPCDPELESYINAQMPDSMPENKKEIVMKAGSLLFVPRGSWHMTSAKTSALSLNFTFTAPTWIDLLTSALRGRLAQSSHWRETAIGFNDEVNYQIAENKLNYLLNDLKEDLPSWRARDILNATECEPF